MSNIKWETIKQYSEILFERNDKVAKITINRPEKLNAFTPVTVQEMIEAFSICRDDSTIGVIILTGAGDKAFSSGGDQSIRGNGGYVGPDKIARLNVLDLQQKAGFFIRSRPKAMQGTLQKRSKVKTLDRLFANLLAKIQPAVQIGRAHV